MTHPSIAANFVAAKPPDSSIIAIVWKKYCRLLNAFISLLLLLIAGVTLLVCADPNNSNVYESLAPLHFGRFMPTDDELSRGIVINASSRWGKQLRRSRSFRMMILSGADTSQYASKLAGYVTAMQNLGTLANTSYVHTEKIPSMEKGIEHSKLHFEDLLDKYPFLPNGLWPNVICIEFSSLAIKGWKAALRVEDLVRYLNALWQNNNLHQPSFMLLEMLDLRGFYSDNGAPGSLKLNPNLSLGMNKSSAFRSWNRDQIAKLSPPAEPCHFKGTVDLSTDLRNSLTFGRAALAGNYLLALARFHGFPMLSMVDALFPAFTRFFAASSSPKLHKISRNIARDRNGMSSTAYNQMWLLFQDGLSLSSLGEKVLVKKIFSAFMDYELNRHDLDDRFDDIHEGSISSNSSFDRTKGMSTNATQCIGIPVCTDLGTKKGTFGESLYNFDLRLFYGPELYNYWNGKGYHNMNWSCCLDKYGHCGGIGCGSEGEFHTSCFRPPIKVGGAVVTQPEAGAGGDCSEAATGILASVSLAATQRGRRDKLSKPRLSDACKYDKNAVYIDFSCLDLSAVTDGDIDVDVELPTDDELDRALVVRPPVWWGHSMRQKRSLRMLLLGGSNTGRETLYAGVLQRAVATRVAAGELHHTSYVLNEGIRGAGIAANLNRKFEFELSHPPELWPNIVSLEFSVNDVAGWESVLKLENLVRILTARWHEKGLRRPSFLLLDLMTVGSVYTSPEVEALDEQPKKQVPGGFRTGRYNRAYPPRKQYFDQPITGNVNAEVAKLNPPRDYCAQLQHQHKLHGRPCYPFGFSRGASTGNYFAIVARFHQIPMLSTADAMFPSFTRHFVGSVAHASGTYEQQRWPFTLDGAHMSYFMSMLLVKRIILPFLDKELNRFDSQIPSISSISPPISSSYFPSESSPHTTELERDSIYDFDVHIFPLTCYSSAGLVSSYQAWGSQNNQLSIANITLQSPGWKLATPRLREPDSAYQCYGNHDALSPNLTPHDTAKVAAEVAATAEEEVLRRGSRANAFNKDLANGAVWSTYPAKFELYFPPATCFPATPCGIEMGYFHSWNRSYVAGGLCRLHPLDKVNNDTVPLKGGYRIVGDRPDPERDPEPMRVTTVHTHRISSNITSEGHYMLECIPDFAWDATSSMVDDALDATNMTGAAAVPAPTHDDEYPHNGGNGAELAEHPITCFTSIVLLSSAGV